MSTNPLISVIIPHFNSQESLKKLVASIPDDPRVEILIVDDRSEVEISESLFEERDNVKVYLNTGVKGAGAARNVGLDNCSGEWLLFADADDYFVEGAFNIILNDIKDNYLVDIIYYKPTSINLINNKVGKRHLSYEKLILEANDKFEEEQINNIKFKFFVPWSKLINRDIVTKNNIKFDEVLFSNDVMFSVQVGYFSKNIKISEDVIYCVTEGEDSLTKNKNKNALLTRLDVTFRSNDFLKQHRMDKYRAPCLNYIIWSKRFGFLFFIKTLMKVILLRQKILPRIRKEYFLNPTSLINKINGFK